MEKSGFYHLFSDGFRTDVLFEDKQAFIAGMNIVALCFLKCNIDILAFCLMDNHVHFILYGTVIQCKDFINMYKRLTGRWILVRYGIKDYLRQLPVDILLIGDEERLLNTLAYLDRNPQWQVINICRESIRGVHRAISSRLIDMLEEQFRSLAKEN